MQVTYDHNLKIAGIGMTPWPRLGLERWLPNYKIAALHPWDVQPQAGAPDIHVLTDWHEVQLDRHNTQHLIDNLQFQDMLLAEFADHAFITYKPVRVPDRLRSVRFLSIDTAIATRLENKAAFRRMMQDTDIPFPAYKIVSSAQFETLTLADVLDGRKQVVAQDDTLSGGKGTFVISDEASYARAQQALKRFGKGKEIVISEYIAGGHERSVQAVVTRYGTFVGPLQKQIIADPLLSNVNVAEGDKFCGAEISPHDTWSALYPEIKQYAEQIGARIHALGYKGIFSLDCLVSPTGILHVLEINPRITGITPLLTMLYRPGQDIPFYLLHVLEMANAEYQITDTNTDVVPPTGSLMMLHSQTNKAGHINHSLSSGLYDPETLEFIRPQIQFAATTDAPQLLVQQYMSKNAPVKPGGRLLAVYTEASVLDDDDRLLPDTAQQVRALLNQIGIA